MQNQFSLAGTLAWQEIRQAYRRSAVGPFWITIGMGVQILTMGLVFGLIFKSEVGTYIPYLSVSVILWGLIASTINEGCQTFISSGAMIKQLDVSKLVYVLKTVLKNFLSFGHNLILIPVVFLVFLKPVGYSLLLFIPGLILLALNLSWVVLLIGIVSARFRDMIPITSSATTIGFFVTPVMWSPELIGNNELAHILLGFNPAYHWLQVARLPILGQLPTIENWVVSFLVAGIGWFVALIAYKKYKSMIAYWV